MSKFVSLQESANDSALFWLPLSPQPPWPRWATTHFRIDSAYFPTFLDTENSLAGLSQWHWACVICQLIG